MTTEELDLVRRYANMSAIYVPMEGEACRILYCDDDEQAIYLEGEETGDEFMLMYNEVDLGNSIWYRLERLVL